MTTLNTNGLTVADSPANFAAYDTIQVSVLDTISSVSLSFTSAGAADLTTQLGARAASILGSNGADTITTGSGNDTLSGRGGADSLSGAAGDDLIDGGNGDDTLVGGLGNDTLIVNSAGDVVTELSNQGTDTVQTSLASYQLGNNIENGTILLTTGATLVGNGLANILTGNIGNDVFASGTSEIDTLIGGQGDDEYSISEFDVILENTGEGTDLVRVGAASYTLGANLENMIGQGLTGQTLTGNSLANSIAASSGNDVIDAAGGADTMAGGNGDDIYIERQSSDVITELGNGGTDTVQTHLVNATLDDKVEILIGLSTANARLTGNDLDNTITGNTGNDTLKGAAGDDTMTGQSGDDLYIVSSVGDAIVELGNGGHDRVETGIAQYTLAGNVEGLASTRTTGALLFGNSLNNSLTGNIGNDTFNGSTGIDTLRGLTGDDLYIVGDSGDLAIEALNEGTDEVRALVAIYTLAANIENLDGGFAGNATYTGNGLANRMDGYTGNDSLSGRAGDDRLNGFEGADTLTGGAGDDVFVFNSTLSGTNIDTLTDMSGGRDEIELESAVFSTLAAGGLAGSAFKIIAGPGAGVLDGTDRILYDAANGNLFYDSDGSGAAVAVQFAQVANFTTAGLSATDFLIV